MKQINWRLVKWVVKRRARWDRLWGKGLQGEVCTVLEEEVWRGKAWDGIPGGMHGLRWVHLYCIYKRLHVCMFVCYAIDSDPLGSIPMLCIYSTRIKLRTRRRKKEALFPGVESLPPPFCLNAKKPALKCWPRKTTLWWLANLSWSRFKKEVRLNQRPAYNRPTKKAIFQGVELTATPFCLKAKKPALKYWTSKIHVDNWLIFPGQQ